MRASSLKLCNPEEKAHSSPTPSETLRSSAWLRGGEKLGAQHPSLELLKGHGSYHCVDTVRKPTL